MDQSQYRHVQIEMEMHIKAPVERVFAALTTEFGNWWPHRYKPDSSCFMEVEVGGKCGERFANGGGAIYGEIVYLDAPHKIISSGSSSLNRGLHGYTVEALESEDGGTLYKRSAQLWGSVPDEIEKMFREGTRAIIERALTNYCEKGVGYVPATGEGE